MVAQSLKGCSAKGLLSTGHSREALRLLARHRAAGQGLSTFASEMFHPERQMTCRASSHKGPGRPGLCQTVLGRLLRGIGQRAEQR